METIKIEMPEWVKTVAPESELFIDLRKYLNNGMEPLPEVAEILKEVRPCQLIHLIGVQKPELLFDVLGSVGFEHYAEPNGKLWDPYLKRCG